MDRSAKARRKMVDTQCAARGILDERVLARLGEVPRELFVPDRARKLAYADRAVALRHGQTISQPYIVAYMSEALRLDGSERVLEVGTGSGYQSAILAGLALEVYTIECVEPLASAARERLAALGLTNLHFRVGDGALGWPDAAPFDRILLTAAPEALPEALLAQLAVGGRLVAPVGGQRQRVVVVDRDAEGFHEEARLPVRFVPLTPGGD